MFSKNMQRLYKRWLILGLLIMCLGVFGFTDVSQTVSATNAPCKQQCEDNQAQCFDSCDTSCSADSTDAACVSCKGGCENSYFNCMSFAIYCGNSSSYSAQCQWNYADHCPVIGGVTDCTHPDTHAGYYQICDRGNYSCVSCPDHDFCYGSNGMPPCY